MLIDKYRIESSSTQYILYEKAIPKPQTAEELLERMAKTGEFIEEVEDDEEESLSGWRPIGYFMHIASLYKFLADHDIRGMGMDDLKAVARRQAELYIIIDASVREFKKDGTGIIASSGQATPESAVPVLPEPSVS